MEKIIINKAIEDLNLNKGWVKDQLKKVNWDSDEVNEFLEEAGKRIYLSKKKIYKIAKMFIEDYENYFNLKWSSWDEFVLQVNSSLKGSNDYWDEIEKIMFNNSNYSYFPCGWLCLK